MPIVLGSCFYWFSFQERELVTQKMASDLSHNDGREKQSPGFLEPWAIPQEDFEFLRSRAWRSQSSIKVIVLLPATHQSPPGGRTSSTVGHTFFSCLTITAGICSAGFMRGYVWEISRSGIFENHRSHI